LLSSLAREAKVAVLITETSAEALLRAKPILYLRDGTLVNPPSDSGRGNVYRLPSTRPRAAGDA
jgi:hypothetical protein